MRSNSKESVSRSFTATTWAGNRVHDLMWISWQSDLPSSVLLMTILWLSSRFHLMDGSGLPFALQRSVTLSPSRTMTSLEVSASSIFGGTARSAARQGNGYYYSCQLNINSKASSTWFKCKNFCILANSVAKKVETAKANKVKPSRSLTTLRYTSRLWHDS